MKFSTILLSCLIGSLLVASLTLCEPTNDGNQSQAAQESSRAKFQMSKVFDFAKYKELFNKSYGSFVEELVRQKLFLAKFFRALISRVKYRHEKADHYLSVNHLSDRTPEELARLHPPASVLADNLNAMRNGESVAPKQPEDSLVTVDEEEFHDALEEIEENKDEPGFKEMAEEIEEVKQEVENLEFGSKSRRKRNTGSSRDERLRGDFIERPDNSVDESLLEPSPESNNPEYVPISHEASEKTDRSVDNNNGGIWSYISKAKEYLPDILAESTAMLKSSVQSGEVEPKRHENDRMFVDLRETGCLNKVRYQGECGSCYAFAAVAMYEFLYCQATGHLVPFSEQYIIDCGFIENLNGCSGGDLRKTLRFIENYGVELRKNWPYRFKASTCPFDEDTNSRIMGYLKVKRQNPAGYTGEALIDIELDDIPKHLDKPIYHGVMIPEDFAEYGGGVHSAATCRPTTSHAMLIVGHGIEDGKEYYLFRNSYASDWGQQGHYKMSAEAIHRCSISSAALQTTSFFPYKSVQETNRFYDHASVKAHYDSHELGNKYLSHLNLE